MSEEATNIKIMLGFKTIREIYLPWEGQHIPSSAKSWQPFILRQRLYQIFSLSGLKTYSWQSLANCLLATPSLSNKPNLRFTLSSCETSHLSLSDSFPQMGTTPPYSPSGEITGRNRWDETHSSAEIWTSSPQQTEKGRMTLCWGADILAECVIVLC